jgi:hypothetical protein
MENTKFVMPPQTSVKPQVVEAVKITNGALGLQKTHCYANLSQPNPYETVKGFSGIASANKSLTTETIAQQNPQVTSVIFLTPSTLAESSLPSVREAMEKYVKSSQDFTAATFEKALTPILQNIREKLSTASTGKAFGNTVPAFSFSVSSLSPSLKTITPITSPRHLLSTDGLLSPHLSTSDSQWNSMIKDSKHWEATLGDGGSIIVARVDNDMEIILKNLSSDSSLTNSSTSNPRSSSLTTATNKSPSLFTNIEATKEKAPHCDDKQTIALVINSSLSSLNHEYRQYWLKALKASKSNPQQQQSQVLTNSSMVRHPYHRGVIELNVRNAARIGHQVAEMMGIETSVASVPDIKSTYFQDSNYTAPLVLAPQTIHHLQIANITSPTFKKPNESVVHYSEVAYNPIPLNHPSWSAPLQQDTANIHSKKGNVKNLIGTYISPVGDMVLWKPGVHDYFGVHGPTTLFPKDNTQFNPSKFKMTSEYASSIESSFEHMKNQMVANNETVVLKPLLMFEIKPNVSVKM